MRFFLPAVQVSGCGRHSKRMLPLILWFNADSVVRDFPIWPYMPRRIIYPHQFRALVIFVANDITGSTIYKSPEEVVKLFRNIVATVRRKYADQPIFLLEITPTKSRWAVWPIVKHTNQLLKETCSKLHHTYFIETASAYLNKDGEPRNELFLKDMLH